MPLKVCGLSQQHICSLENFLKSEKNRKIECNESACCKVCNRGLESGAAVLFGCPRCLGSVLGILCPGRPRQGAPCDEKSPFYRDFFLGGAFFPCLRAIAAPFRLSESPKLPRRLGPGHAGAKRGNFLGAPHTRRAPHRKTLKKRVFRVFSVSNRCVGPAASGAPKMPKFGIRAAHTRSFAAHLGSEVVPRCFKKLPLAPTPSTNPSGFRVGLRGGAGWVGLGW